MKKQIDATNNPNGKMVFGPGQGDATLQQINKSLEDLGKKLDTVVEMLRGSGL